MRFSPAWLILPLVACRDDRSDTASVLVIDDAASADTVLSTLTDEGAVWIDPASGEVELILASPSPGALYPAAVSPDGRSIATVYRESLLLIDVARDEAVVLWAGSVDAEVCSRQDPDLSLDCFVEPHNPQFSPDGSKLVFGARPTFGDNYNAELRVLELATGAVTVLAEREYHQDQAVFGHDSESVYWVRDFDTIVAGRSGAGEPEVVYRGAVNGLSVAWPGLAR